MTVRNVIDLLVLGMLWGVSFLFLRVAVPEFGAIPLIAVRVVLAAAILVPLVLARGQLREIAANWRAIAVMGLLHYAIPFSLFAWAVLTLSGGYASVINATSPLFAAIVARAWLGERLAPGRVAGLLVGFAGVVLLLWETLVLGDGLVLLAVAASLLGAFCYGLAAVYARKRLAGVAPMAVAGGSMSFAAIALLPVAAWFWPAAPVSPTAWSTAAVLGVVSTALAFVLYFRLIDSAGPSKAITVTFLIPLFAVAFGAAFIGEEVTASMLLGGAVILFGTALATGLIEAAPLWQKTRSFATRSLVVVAAMYALDDTPPDVHAAEPVARLELITYTR